MDDDDLVEDHDKNKQHKLKLFIKNPNNNKPPKISSASKE
jgi:hypothetical protein